MTPAKILAMFSVSFESAISNFQVQNLTPSLDISGRFRALGNAVGLMTSVTKNEHQPLNGNSSPTQ